MSTSIFTLSQTGGLSVISIPECQCVSQDLKTGGLSSVLRQPARLEHPSQYAKNMLNLEASVINVQFHIGLIHRSTVDHVYH